MASNLGFDESEEPYAELGADTAHLTWDGTRFTAVDDEPGFGVTFEGTQVLALTDTATLTAFPDMDPVPRVLLDIPSFTFPPGAVKVSLVRAAEGRTMDVRGGQKLTVGAPAVVLDLEAPFGVESSYSIVGYDANGNVTSTLPVGTITLNFDQVVIQQPLDARLSVAIERMRDTGTATSRDTPFQLAYPQGRSLPSMVGLGPRHGFGGVEWELLAATHEDADNLQATLGTYGAPQLPVWLVRTPLDTKHPTRTQRIPRVFFCAVSSLVEHDTYRLTDTGMVHFTAVTTEITPPAAGITGVALTYADVNVFYDLYSEVGAQYATYTDLKRDTSLIGAADA